MFDQLQQQAPETCRYCGSDEIETNVRGDVQHYAEAKCGSCCRHLEWLSEPAGNPDGLRYSHETDFSQLLADSLEGADVVVGDGRSKVVTSHNSKRGKKRQPDITVRLEDETSMEWRDLTNPFYIECKMGREYREGASGASSMKQIQDNLIQLLKYNYERDSQQVKDLEKYGDRHVAVTTPLLVHEKHSMRDFTEDYINKPQLVRTLWKLGLGILYRNTEGEIVMAFNEKEQVYFEDFEIPVQGDNY